MVETGQQVVSKKEAKKLEKSRSCTIVPYPKVVFFYPLMLISLVCAIFQFTTVKTGVESPIAGSLFIVAFLINVLVIAFDFPGVKALALFLGIIVVVLGVLYLDVQYNILPGVQKIFRTLHESLYASTAFYLLISGILFIMVFGGILVNWLWNRWTVEPNRLLHKHGLLGELTEFPVIDLQMDKDIDDVFEYLLLRSGTLTFRPNPSTAPIRLENVPRITSKEKKIQYITRQLAVSSK